MLGDHLTVALSSDEFNALKGKRAHFPWEARREDLMAIRYVDEVIREDNWDQKVIDVRNRNIDVFAMGDDWQGEFDFLKPHCKVVYLARTPGISSTMIRSSFKVAEPAE